MKVVNGGSKGGVLDLGREKGGRRRRLRWEQTDELQCFCVRPSAGNTIFFGNGLVDGG